MGPCSHCPRHPTTASQRHARRQNGTQQTESGDSDAGDATHADRNRRSARAPSLAGAPHRTYRDQAAKPATGPFSPAASPSPPHRNALEEAAAPKGDFMSGCKGSYQRLEQRLGGNVWRVQSGWRAFWGRTEATGRAERHAKVGGGGVPPCVTFRLVVVPLRGPGQSPVLPFACCVGLLLSSAAAAGALAGIVSAFAEPSIWCWAQMWGRGQGRNAADCGQAKNKVMCDCLTHGEGQGGRLALERGGGWAVCATGAGAHQGQTSREGEKDI